MQSMTGFGAASGRLSPRLEAEVRLTSLNSRFLEVTLRAFPRVETTELEAPVRAVLGEKLARGRVTATFELRLSGQDPEGALKLHWEVAEALLEQLGQRPEGLELAPLTLRDLVSLPGFVESGRELRLDEGETRALLALVAAARDALAERRSSEGAALLPQVTRELAELEEFRAYLGEVNAGLGATLRARLRERLVAAVGELLPEERVLQEAAVAADRSDVSEEVERLLAHLQHFRALLGSSGPVGKKLDFLMQELLREVNTAGSKCREAGMGERVVAAKAALERLREQCANLE